MLYVYETQEGMHAFAKTDQMLEENFGVSAARLEGSDLTALEPGLRAGLSGAYHYRGDTSLNPEKLNQAWVEQLRKQGVEFIENTALQEVEKE